jgi:hypothetical protein
MSTLVSRENLTNPGMEPVDGDTVKLTYEDGSISTMVFVSNTVSQNITPIRIITVAAFMDRLDLGGKLNTIYEMVDAGRQATPPNYDLFKVMENIKRREYINLDDPRIRPTLEAIGLYTTAELDSIFVDGTVDEEPEIL